jgi:hypothetical protein
MDRYAGNLAPMPGVFPNYPAPVIRNTDNGTELAMMRWGTPPPPHAGGGCVTSTREDRGNFETYRRQQLDLYWKTHNPHFPSTLGRAATEGRPYGRAVMRLRLPLIVMLLVFPLAHTPAEEAKSFRDKLREMAPQPPPSPPPEVKHTKEELIAKARELAQTEVPLAKVNLERAAAHGEKSYSWWVYNPLGQGAFGDPWLDLKSIDEMRVFAEALVDVLKLNMTGVAFALKYPEYPGKPRSFQITASW